jgi:hypothetical protein
MDVIQSPSGGLVKKSYLKHFSYFPAIAGGSLPEIVVINQFSTVLQNLLGCPLKYLGLKFHI